MLIENLNCPGCGAPVDIKEKKCDYCKQNLIIKDFKTIKKKNKEDVKKYLDFYKILTKTDINNYNYEKSQGICFLKLGLYENAINSFKKYIEKNIYDSDVIFYLTISLLKGKKPFLTPRSIIDEIVEKIEAAILIEEKEIYKYFYAYIKFDFFKRKSYKTIPTYNELLDEIYDKINDDEIEELFEILKTERPDEM